MIREWLRERKLLAEDRLFRRGFNYAAGELLWGTDPEKLKAESETAFDYGMFERGIKIALKYFDKLKTERKSENPPPSGEPPV